MSRSLGFFLIALRSAICGYIDRFYALYWYVKSPTFRRVDSKLHWRYLFLNPYKICRKHWGKKFADAPYGETPLKTLADIAHIATIQPSDTVLELGCGRGRGAFWLASCVGCRVIAVDIVERFIRMGREIAAASDLDERVEFHCSDFFRAPLDRASVVYLYGTGLEEATWMDLAVWFGDLPQRPLLITVSHSLAEFSPYVTLLGHCDLEFGWGKARVYLQKFRQKEQ